MTNRGTPAVVAKAERIALWASLALGAALRLYVTFTDDGIYWPDEVYQSLEPAHRLVYGYGLVAWEFVEGARNWALSGLVAGLLWLARLVGLDTPEGYLAVVRLAFVAASIASAFGAAFLARRLGADRLSAAAGAALLLLAAPAIYFSHRAMSETVFALPAVFGLALALPSTSSRKEVLLGASLVGMSVLLRL